MPEITPEQRRSPRKKPAAGKARPRSRIQLSAIPMTRPEFDHAWAPSSGPRAIVTAGQGVTLVFFDAQTARDLAAACLEAARELDKLAAGTSGEDADA